MKEGVHKVAVYPGIARDGIRDLRAQYPFMAPWENKNINFVKDSVITLKPVFTYYPVGDNENMHVRWMENFDSGSITIQPTSESDTSIIRASGPLAWHDAAGLSTYSAKLVLTSDTMESVPECCRSLKTSVRSVSWVVLLIILTR